MQRTTIWAIGGGKGGVGKSLITANISICMALMGHKVVLIDLDLGGANLHTCLGIPLPSKTLSDYTSKKIRNFNDLVTPTLIKNLSLISGAQDHLDITNLKHLQKTKILSKISSLDADYVLLDLGAGTMNHTLDFFIAADQKILISLPEPTSIENTYRFIKSILYRRLKTIDTLYTLSSQVDHILNLKISENISPSLLVDQISEQHPEEGELIRREITSFLPKLIVNQIRLQSDINTGHSMKIICKKYFGIELEYIGYLNYDSAVWQSIKNRTPLIIESPNSSLVQSFDRIITKLMN